MNVVVFLGPSLPVSEARVALDAVYLPPAQQADLLSSIATYKPDVIGLIDGVFFQSLSVWHKEILYAIDCGVRVYGASSMGALRAAETADFGMIGVGEVYRMYADGELNDDDEVALAHGPAETGYIKLSEPMVNFRKTLALAEERRVIDAEMHQLLIAIAKSIYFPERTIPLILARAAVAGVPGEVLNRLSEFMTHNYQDIKRQDALLLLETIRDQPPVGHEDTLGFVFARSFFFDTLYNRDRDTRHGEVNISLASISNYVALHNPDFAEVNDAALNRALCGVLADLLDVAVSEETVEHEQLRFRSRYGLTEDEAFAVWLRGNDLSNEEFNILMRETARRRALHRWLLTRHFLDSSTKFVLDELRLRNDYEAWAEVAAIQERILQVHYPLVTQTSAYGLQLGQLVRDHLLHTNCVMDVPYTDWAEEAGFLTLSDLRLELVRSSLAREVLLRVAEQLDDITAADPSGSFGSPLGEIDESS